jgi:hypothetical protein
LGAAHPVTEQVDRIALLGLGRELLDRAGSLRSVLEALPIGLRAQVVSQRYTSPEDDGSRRDCRGNSLAATGKWRNGKNAGTAEDGMSPVKCFDTLPLQANKLGTGYEDDPTYRQLAGRGGGYMGCDRPGAPYPEGCGK